MASDITRNIVRPPLLGVTAGALAAACTRAVDALVDVPGSVATGNARGLLAAAFGAVVTVGAFSFWMRPVAAQLAASTVPPRLMAGHLYDRFQRGVITVTAGVLGFLAVVLLSFPSAPDEPAPVISTIAGALLGVGAIAALLLAMRHAESSTRPSVVLAESANDVIDHIRLSAVDDPIEHAEIPDGAPPAQIRAPASGWVRDVAHEDLIAIAPKGSTVLLEADVGTFVVAGWTSVIAVWPEGAVDAEMRSRLASRLDIGHERASPHDIVGSLSQFIDVGIHAAAGSASSPSTVYEAMWWLGAVLHELARHRDIGFPDIHLEDGRTLIRHRRMSTPELADLAVDRIRQVTADHPAMALELLRVMLDAREAARQAERHELCSVLDEQADLVVEQCRRGNGLPSDIERVVEARGRRRTDRRTGARHDEYPAAQSTGP